MKWYYILLIVWLSASAGFIFGLTIGFQLCANRIRRGHRVPMLFTNGDFRKDENWNTELMRRGGKRE